MLEEPSSDTIFILTCQNERELPKTIVSRCQIIRFRPLAREEVNDILVKDFSIKEEDAKFLSVLSGSNMKKVLILREKDAVKRKNDIIDGFASFKQNTDFMAKSKKDELLQAMDIVLGFYRDLLVYKFTKDQNLIMNIDRLNEIIELTDAMKPDRIQDGINSIEYAKSALRSNANTKLTIKVLQERLAV
jgi:DNA polymerase-3 subunit delta'